MSNILDRKGLLVVAIVAALAIGFLLFSRVSDNFAPLPTAGTVPAVAAGPITEREAQQKAQLTAYAKCQRVFGGCNPSSFFNWPVNLISNQPTVFVYCLRGYHGNQIWNTWKARVTKANGNSSAALSSCNPYLPLR